MRTAESEAKNIITKINNLIKYTDQSKMLIGNTTIPDELFLEFYRGIKNGEIIENLIENQFLNITSELDFDKNKKFKSYAEFMKSLYKVSGYCAAAVHYHQSGNEVKAWQYAFDASVNFGIFFAFLSGLTEKRYTKDQNSQKKAAYGKIGGEKRGLAYKPLKDWAIKEAAKRRGTPTEIARSLINIIPKELEDLPCMPVDKERLIRAAIAEENKKLASRNG